MKDSKQFIGIIICVVIICGLSGIGVSLGAFESLKEINFGLNISLTTVFSLLIMTAEVILIAKVINIILGLFKSKKHRIATIVTISQSLVSYASAIVIICAGLSILGVDVTTIAASVGIVALIVGFGAESLIEDVITGLFMLFENQYNVGDILEINGFRGTVTNIGIRTTCITDPGGNIKIVNNSNMKDILNRSDNTSRAISEIQIPYETDIEDFEKKIPLMMTNIYKRHEDKMKKEPFYLGVSELGNSGVTLKFYVEVDEKNIYSCQRILNRELWVEFRKVGVEVPFTQVDIHKK